MNRLQDRVIDRDRAGPLSWAARLCWLAFAPAALASGPMPVPSVRIESLGLTLLPSRPPDWQDPGDYTRLDFQYDDGRRVRLSGLEGMPFGQTLSAPATGAQLQAASAVDSGHLLVLPRAQAAPLLVLWDWAYGSSPGRVRILELGSAGPRLVFDESLWIDHLEQVRDDWEIGGLRCLQSPEDPPSYAPRLVYTRALLSGASFRLNLARSKARSLRWQRVWDGPDCADLAVVRGGKDAMATMPRAQALALVERGQRLLPRRRADGSLW